LAKPKLIAVNILTGGELVERKFKVVLSKSAAKYLQRLDRKMIVRIRRCFLNLEQNPLAGGDIKPISGEDDYFRYRVGDLRIIYFLNLTKRRVEITTILSRGQAYKRK